jgi:hypothetical protein
MPTRRRNRRAGEYGFRNLQRILVDQYATARMLMGLLLTVNLAGGAGYYKIVTGPSPKEWCGRLGLAMLVTNVALFIIWLREHNLKNAVLKRLKQYTSFSEGNGFWVGATKFILFLAWVGVSIFWLYQLLNPYWPSIQATFRRCLP